MGGRPAGFFIIRIKEKNILFICPTVAGKGVAADLDYSKDKVEINGNNVDPMLGWIRTYPFNIFIT